MTRQAFITGDPFRHTRSIVVKVGSAVLGGAGGLDADVLDQLARQIAELRTGSKTVTLVSSGAVLAGRSALGMTRPTDLARLQAIAALGQRRLMDAWAAAFAKRGLDVGQLLLTRADADDRQRFLNLRDCLRAVHELDAVPVVNENDTIGTEELTSFGDNDLLAAVISAAIHADALVLLSTAPGLVGGDGGVIDVVDDLATARRHVFTGTDAKGADGRGGMASKLDAATIVCGAGAWMAIADGRRPNVLTDLFAGDTVGTVFKPTHTRRTGRSLWIGTARTVGVVHVDDGAAKALRGGDASLLPIGVLGATGSFSRGDIVAIHDPTGTAIARGLVRYDSADIPRIAGRRTPDLADLDPPANYDEVIHRDDLVLS
ncbi:MAG: glutamate 5-kinase [Planctomycetota bacterium]